jgi:hypothetical protein
VAVQGSLVGTGFSGGTGFNGWYWFQWLEVSLVIPVSVAVEGSMVIPVSVTVEGSLVGTGYSGGRCLIGWCFSGCFGFSGDTLFVKQNTAFITKRLQSFGSESFAH